MVEGLKMIIETDLGGDPDDFFALCYLQSKGIKFKAWFITPGYSTQIAIAKFLRDKFEQDFPIFSSKPGKSSDRKDYSHGFHQKVLTRHNAPFELEADEDKIEISEEDNWFVIGPAIASGEIALNQTHQLGKLLMQGGFLPYSKFSPKQRLEKFEGHEFFPTFNMMGCPSGLEMLLLSNFSERRFVGKNICHTVVYNKQIHERVLASNTKSIGGELIREGMSIYLDQRDQKAFHDPLSAVLSLYPEFGVWVKATPTRMKNGFTSIPNENENNFVLADLDREQFWFEIVNT